MITEGSKKQSELEIIMTEKLVPEDHLLRRIDQYIDFSAESKKQ